MRLCDSDIEIFIEKGLLKIEPRPSSELISGVTVDLHLGNQFRIFNNHTIPYVDLNNTKSGDNKLYQLIDMISDEIYIPPGNAFFIHPGELSLAVTEEVITLPDNLVGWLDGRSSLARLGLMVHVTAHRIDPGWSGALVLECYNNGKLPLALYPGIAICAISFETLTAPAMRPYYKRYVGEYKLHNDYIAGN